MLFQDLPPPEPQTSEIRTDDASNEVDEIIFVHTREEILITASTTQIAQADSPKSSTVLTPWTVARLGETRAVDLLRLLPSVSISETGPRGTQAQLRLRGAEANHNILLIDGIKANDPAAGNEPRYELLTDSLFDRIEIIRGPQSAIWGSEAIGGVIGITHLTVPDRSAALRLEAGSFGSVQGLGEVDLGGDTYDLNVSVSGQSSDGIDSFGFDGERDGYNNISARMSGSVPLGEDISLSLNGFAVDAHSEYDGFDPLTFQRADTLDSTDNRLGAARLALRFGDASATGGFIGASLLASENINRLDTVETNRTSAERYRFEALASQFAELIGLEHVFVAGISHEIEDFRASDVAFGGFTDQQQSRAATGLIAEWLVSDGDRLNMQFAMRHDIFSAFEDATSFSAGLDYELGNSLSLVANFGEGIAQPSFYDLYGFFPGSFVGNPDLRPERSIGYDIGMRFRDSGFFANLSWFEQDLDDEIVDIFDFATFTSTTANGEGTSYRRGIEIEAGYEVLSDALKIAANYSYLDATEPEAPDGTTLAEVRRPSHRGAIILTGKSGAITYGGNIAIVGERFDTDFDVFPAERVALGAYALASARIAYALSEEIEVSLRGSNLFDADYQDVIGYNTQGRAVFVGLRFTP